MPYQQYIYSTEGTSSRSSNTSQSQLSKYLCELVDDSAFDSFDTLNFWIQWENIYNKLALVAQDILAAPASPTYVERVFSVCGWLTAGRRNRMNKILQLNAKVLANTCFNAGASEWTVI